MFKKKEFCLTNLDNSILSNNTIIEYTKNNSNYSLIHIDYPLI